MKLYRHSARGAKLVDELVVDYRFHPDDCVIYKAIHGTGPSSRKLFGVCGDQPPVQLADEESDPPVEIGPAGAVQWRGFAVANGHVFREGRRLTWADLRELAYTKPRPHERDGGDLQREVFREFRQRVTPNEVDESGRSMFELAIIEGPVEVVRQMIRDGASPTTPLPDGYSPLHLAVATDNPAMVKALIELGADVNALDPGGSSVIQKAATRGQSEIIQILIDAGARMTPELQNRIGTDPRLR